MAGRRRWREPVLAITGVALALASGAAGVALVNAFSDDEDLIAYSVESTDRQPTPTATLEAVETEAPTEEATSTPTPRQATATATPRPATPTRTIRPATSTATPRPATATPTRRPPTATPTRRPATPTPTPRPPTATATPAGLTLSQSSFSLPGDATANGGSAIGPFCCQGRTVTLRTSAGDVAGYVYWYRWSSGFQNLPPRDASAVSDVGVAVYDQSTGSEALIIFAASEAAPGASKSVDHGRFRFTVTITSAVQTTYAGGTYVYESDLAATLSVSIR
jgi:hypothetical protein